MVGFQSENWIPEMSPWLNEAFAMLKLINQLSNKSQASNPQAWNNS